MTVSNHKQIIGFEYRMGKRGWKFRRSFKYKAIVADLSAEVFRPPHRCADQKRLHLKLLLDALHERNLDNGSVKEIINDRIYRVEIEVKMKEKKYEGHTDSESFQQFFMTLKRAERAEE